MTVQEARTELRQIHVFYNRILERKQRLAELRSAMKSIRVCKFGNQPVRGATEHENYRLETTIDRCTKLETEIADDILAMSEAQQVLVDKIEQLPEPYSDVLARVYIHRQRFERVAVDTHYSYRQVQRLHHIALQKYCDL
ncbi:MAG: hypothetical protein NC350_03965 [Corallococcus sp.]|nr:hypothetical protein [Corallococcus sp.]